MYINACFLSYAAKPEMYRHINMNIRYILIVLLLVETIFSSPGEDILNNIQCDGHVYNRTTYGCCTQVNGTELVYERSKKFCCDHKVYFKIENFECCEKSEKQSIQYHAGRQLCCNGELVDKSQDIHEECCGTKKYNPNNEKCDRNIILLIYESTCNGSKYYLNKNICCNGHLFEEKAEDGIKCCGETFIYIDKQICCDDQPLTKKKNMKCCGKKVINNKSHCCHGNEYDATSHTCEDGQIKKINLLKCFIKQYNPQKEICCGYKVVAKEHDDQDGCCQGNLKPPVLINSKTQVCVRGEVQSKIHCKSEDPKKYTCCHNKRYSISSYDSMCCGNIAKKKPARGLVDNCQSSLCGNKMYNNRNFICCDEQLFDRYKYHCKNKKVYKMFNFQDGLFNEKIQTCGHYAVVKSNNIGCCVGMPHKKEIKCPFMWRSKTNQLKSNNYQFWDIIECRTTRMTGNIIDVKPISENKFTVRFKVDNDNFEVRVHIKNQKSKTKLMKEGKGKTIYVFYKKKLGYDIILGTYGAISLEKHSKSDKLEYKCPEVQEIW